MGSGSGRPPPENGVVYAHLILNMLRPIYYGCYTSKHHQAGNSAQAPVAGWGVRTRREDLVAQDMRERSRPHPSAPDSGRARPVLGVSGAKPAVQRGVVMPRSRAICSTDPPDARLRAHPNDILAELLREGFGHSDILLARLLIKRSEMPHIRSAAPRIGPGTPACAQTTPIVGHVGVFFSRAAWSLSIVKTPTSTPQLRRAQHTHQDHPAADQPRSARKSGKVGKRYHKELTEQFTSTAARALPDRGPFRPNNTVIDDEPVWLFVDDGCSRRVRVGLGVRVEVFR